MSEITRFAPSPTGALHLGHARAALAAAAAGRMLLRIEDIDAGRCRPDYVDGILADLAWLGLDWPEPVRRQSEHLADYAACLDRLDGEGLLYPCFCTRADIAREVARLGQAPHEEEGPPYPGTCRHLSAADRADRIAAGQAYALRLDMAGAIARTGPLGYRDGDGRHACHPARFGDVVLARKDQPASYHLCVTHDDALQGVTLVTRGADLRGVTDIHRTLQALLGWPEPRYAHHPLVVDATGRRLAKRDHAATLADLRARGVSAAAVRGMAAGE